MTQQPSEINRPVTRTEAYMIQAVGGLTTTHEEKLAAEIINRIQKIDRLQFASETSTHYHICQTVGTFTTSLDKKLPAKLITTTKQIAPLLFSLQKRDRCNNVLDDLCDDAYLATHDMEEIP